ncbi:MAG: hypothetical protein AAGA48_36240 [Myxococcota bacterium]
MNGRCIVAAVQEELGPLMGFPIGIGGIRSACGITTVLETHRPTEVVLVGTAGAYPGARGIPIATGEACVASRLGWASGTAELGFGYVPRAPEPLASDPEWVEALTARGVPTATVLTVPAITTDPHLVARLGADWMVEHLETYSVAHACAVRGVRFVAVLGIANVVGPNAHEEYMANRHRAQAAAQAAVAMLPDPN